MTMIFGGKHVKHRREDGLPERKTGKRRDEKEEMCFMVLQRRGKCLLKLLLESEPCSSTEDKVTTDGKEQ